MAVATATTSNVIRNVKLIGFESRNGRVYPPEVLSSAVHLYEGAKVNVDHPERGPMAERRIGDRIGQIKNVRYVAGSGLHGDFVFNPHHSMAGQIQWDAENSPESLGFSHNATMRLGRPDHAGREVVEAIVHVRSIDLVADPATTSSMFESVDHRRESASQVATDRQFINLVASKLQPPRESLSELRTRAELLKLTLARLDAREMASKRFETSPQAKVAREAYLRRFASRLNY